MKKLPLLLVSLAIVAGVAASLGGCSSTIENRDPSGEPFPSVEATSLAGETVEIPEDFAGAPVLLLVGYVQDTQFDIDRWLYGAIDAELEVVQPAVLVTLGATAMRAVYGPTSRLPDPLSAPSASPSRYAAATLSTFHPAAILRASDGARRSAMRALSTSTRGGSSPALLYVSSCVNSPQLSWRRVRTCSSTVTGDPSRATPKLTCQPR